MQKFVIILMLFVAIAGCKKSKINLLSESLYGKWELCSSSSGRGGITHYPVGNGNTIMFNNNGTYYAIGMQRDTGTYSILTWTNAWGENGNLLDLNGKTHYQWEMMIRNDTLSLDNHSTIADGGGLDYKKL